MSIKSLKSKVPHPIKLPKLDLQTILETPLNKKPKLLSDFFEQSLDAASGNFLNYDEIGASEGKDEGDEESDEESKDETHDLFSQMSLPNFSKIESA